jgi:hypothetical protein
VFSIALMLQRLIDLIIKAGGSRTHLLQRFASADKIGIKADFAGLKPPILFCYGAADARVKGGLRM